MEENHVPQNLEEVDSLLSSIESPSSTAETKSAAPTPEESVKVDAVKQAEAEYELERRGKKEKFPLSKVLSLANQGFDYNEKMREYNLQRNLFDKERTTLADKVKAAEEIQSRINQYREIEEYNKKDPNWWKHVIESYNAKRVEQGQSPSLQVPAIEKLIEEKVAPFKEFITSQQERETLIQRAKEDADLDGEIASFREENKFFDWNTLDKNGHDLEMRILKYAQDNKIASFRAAARDMLFDEYVKRAEVAAKEDLGKSIQKTTKLGLGVIKDKPSEKLSALKDVRAKSWDDVTAEALAELRVQ